MSSAKRLLVFTAGSRLTAVDHSMWQVMGFDFPHLRHHCSIDKHSRVLAVIHAASAVRFGSPLAWRESNRGRFRPGVRSATGM